MGDGGGTRRMVITGAAGFIGSHLIDALLAAGHEVVGIDSFEDYYPRSFKEANLARARSATLHPGRGNILDWQSPTCVRRLHLARRRGSCTAADVVFHLAAQAGVRASWGRSFGVTRDNNVLATQRLLEACRARACPVVYASSSSVYGDTDSCRCTRTRLPPALALRRHQAGRRAALASLRKNHGLPTVSLRYFTVYGPRQRPDMAFHQFIRAMLQGPSRSEMYGPADQTRDFTFVDDIRSLASCSPWVARTAPSTTWGRR